MTPVDPVRSHGIYDMKAFGRLLRVRAAGGWNEPTALRFNEEYKKRISTLPEGPWGVYFDLRNWGLAIPDALPFLNDLGSWPAPQGRGTHMFLFNGMNIQESMINSMLNVTNHETYFFTTAGEAEVWIIRQHFYSGDIKEVVEPILRD